MYSTKNFFRDLSGCYLEWEMLKDGKVMRSGRVDDLNVAPQQTAKVNWIWELSASVPSGCINVSYKIEGNVKGLLTGRA